MANKAPEKCPIPLGLRILEKLRIGDARRKVYEMDMKWKAEKALRKKEEEARNSQSEDAQLATKRTAEIKEQLERERLNKGVGSDELESMVVRETRSTYQKPEPSRANGHANESLELQPEIGGIGSLKNGTVTAAAKGDGGFSQGQHSPPPKSSGIRDGDEYLEPDLSGGSNDPPDDGPKKKSFFGRYGWYIAAVILIAIAAYVFYSTDFFRAGSSDRTQKDSIERVRNEQKAAEQYRKDSIEKVEADRKRIKEENEQRAEAAKEAAKARRKQLQPDSRSWFPLIVRENRGLVFPFLILTVVSIVLIMWMYRPRPMNEQKVPLSVKFWVTLLIILAHFFFFYRPAIRISEAEKAALENSIHRKYQNSPVVVEVLDTTGTAWNDSMLSLARQEAERLRIQLQQSESERIELLARVDTTQSVLIQNQPLTRADSLAIHKAIAAEKKPTPQPSPPKPPKADKGRKETVQEKVERPTLKIKKGKSVVDRWKGKD